MKKPQLNPNQETIKAVMQRQNIETGLGATSLQHIRANSQQELRRIKAEDKIAMEALGGKIEEEKDDVMGDVIIGDHSTYTEVKAPKNTFGQMAGKALLAAAIAVPIAWIVNSYFNRPITPVVVGDDSDTITELGIYRDPVN